MQHEACGCHKEHLACTSYCNCSGEEDCFNPHTKRQDAALSGDEGVEEEDFEEMENFEERDFEETEMDVEEDFVEEDIEDVVEC